jgi:hypothetical protein
MFQLHSSGHYQQIITLVATELEHYYAGDLIEKVEPIIFLAVLIQRPVPNNLASQSP